MNTRDRSKEITTPLFKEYPGLNAFCRCLGIKPGESVLILTDTLASADAVNLLAEACKELTPLVELDNGLPLQHFEDMPVEFHEKIRHADIIILAASQSWYHAQIRKKAKYELSKRVVECYNLSLEMLKGGALCGDYDLISRLTRKLIVLFEGKAHIRIITAAGTDITAEANSIKCETGCYDMPGTGGNLPAGEVSVGTLEGTVNGKIIFDLSIDILGELKDRPLELTVKNGRVADVKGLLSKKMNRLLVENDTLRNVVEIGVGTNPYSILGRTIMEDEKKCGTVHIGLGNNTYFGGRIPGPHYDGVLSHPTILFDDEEVMRDGRFFKKFVPEELAAWLKTFNLLHITQ